MSDLADCCYRGRFEKVGRINVIVKVILSLHRHLAVGFWPPLRKRTVLKRIILWSLVAVYTFFLPDAIFVYQVIVGHFSSDVAGKVPILIIILFGLTYVVFGLLKEKPLRCLSFIIPAAILVYAIIGLESNPNKHIHIPEYILMSWIVFEALSLDYRGKGIFLLLFICSSMLGIVDELGQGIHPHRSYGWSDMVINSASTIIGVFSLMGLRRGPAGDWAWIGRLKKLKESLGLVIFGAIGAAFMCVYLLDVKANHTFWGVYPLWLLGWNVLFLVLAPVRIFFHCHGLIAQSQGHEDGKDSFQNNKEATAHLWVLLPLFILLAMHAIVILTFLYGWEFQ